ncbi:hypothetical protein J4442_02250 [Candidatus Woesearchaeota archaeon]|nr:hypothetical protein [Candidatus Woesearchaeota archaeon]
MEEQPKISPQVLNEKIRAFAFSDSYDFTPNNLVRLEERIRDNKRIHQCLAFPYNCYFKGLEDIRRLLPHKGAFSDKERLDGLLEEVLPIFDTPFFSQFWEYNQDYHAIFICGRSKEVPAILLEMDIRDSKGIVNYASLNLKAERITYDYPSPPKQTNRREAIPFDYNNGLWILTSKT